MTTKVEPTVEKWDGHISECCGVRANEWISGGIVDGYTCTKCHKACNVRIPPCIPKWEEKIAEIIDGWDVVYKTTDYDDLLSCIRTLLSHSVQEAKAEENGRLLTKLNEIIAPTNLNDYSDGWVAYTELLEKITTLVSDLLASLKQEEDKV